MIWRAVHFFAAFMAAWLLGNVLWEIFTTGNVAVTGKPHTLSTATALSFVFWLGFLTASSCRALWLSVCELLEFP